LADYCLIDVHEIERIGRGFADCCLIDVHEIERIDSVSDLQQSY